MTQDEAHEELQDEVVPPRCPFCGRPMAWDAFTARLVRLSRERWHCASCDDLDRLARRDETGKKN